ncbi:MAG: cysteine desulfurase [Rikenellaceae bacterium]
MFDFDSIAKDFPLLNRQINGRRLVYLDSAATAQKPQCVIDKMNAIYTNCNGNIHRAAHTMSNEVTAQYENARQIIKNFIGAESVKSIVFTSGATASINLVAYSYGVSIKKGDSIIVSEMEHHSNIVPWQMLCERTGAELKVIPFDENGELDARVYLNMLSSNTKIVAITAASNFLGTMPDLEFYISKAHEVGAKVVVDACQGVVHGEINVKELDCDFLAFSAHKLYAPTGMGVLYGKEELLEAMPPFLGGGDMVDTVTFQKTTYAELPLKFEAGTTPYVEAIGLSEAIEYLNRIDFAAARSHEHALLSYATERLGKIEGLRIYGNAKRRCSLLSFNIDGIHPFDLALLLDKQGVAVRSGTHCAQPAMQHFSITGSVRASFAFYNSFDDIDVLYSSIERAVTMLR